MHTQHLSRTAAPWWRRAWWRLRRWLKPTRLDACRHFLVFSVETDELPRWDTPAADNAQQWPRLLQLAWVVIDRHGNIAEQHTHDTTEGFSAVLKLFDQSLQRCDCIASHNISFGINMIEVEALRHGTTADWHRLPRICTMRESTEWCRLPHPTYIYKWPRLGELHMRLFDEPLTDDITAMSNALTTARCLAALLDMEIIR